MEFKGWKQAYIIILSFLMCSSGIPKLASCCTHCPHISNDSLSHLLAFMKVDQLFTLTSWCR